MARYKETEKDQGLFLTVNLSEQIVPGTYEYTLSRLIDNKLDLRIFDRKYTNDETGAAAIEPGILLKIILYCYSMGVISSRKIAKMCKENMVVKALAEDIEPHHTTISNFVSGMGGEIEKVFSEVLLVCGSMGLIGGKMFAIDGCRLPSNASKEWSGTKMELQKKYERIKEISRKILRKHRENDIAGEEKEADKKKLQRLEAQADKILEFLESHEERKGAGGKEIQSNITDNESGKIQGPHGVIQGYNGIAVADSKNQVIVAANAYGSVSEGQFFPQMLEETERNMRTVKRKKKPLKGTVMLGDNGYFSEDNLQAAKEKGMEAIIPDEQFRKVLKFMGRVKLNRNEGNKYQSRVADCKGCPYADRCMHSKKKQGKQRTLYIPILKYKENLAQKMREKIDKPKYRKIYSRRMQIIEPVFADITYCKGITRFTLRSRRKVNIQWLLYCLVHNIGKCNAAEKGKKVA